jgi:hypothetical protein
VFIFLRAACSAVADFEELQQSHHAVEGARLFGGFDNDAPGIALEGVSFIALPRDFVGRADLKANRGGGRTAFHSNDVVSL